MGPQQRKTCFRGKPSLPLRRPHPHFPPLHLISFGKGLPKVSQLKAAPESPKRDCPGTGTSQKQAVLL